jgi:chromosome segregation ATPase
LNTVQSDVADVKTGLNTVQSDVADVKTDLNAVQSDVADVKTDLNAVQSDVADATSNIDSLKSTVADVKGGLNTVQSTVANVKTDLNVVQSDVADATSNIDSLKSTVADVKTDLNTVQSNVTATIKDVSTLKEWSTGVDVDQIVSFINSAGKTFESQSSELARIGSNILDMSQKIQQHDSTLLESIGSSLSPDDKSIFSNVVSTVDRLGSSVNNLNSSVDILKQKSVEHDANLSELKNTDSQLDAILNTKNQQVHDALKQLEQSMSILETKTLNQLNLTETQLTKEFTELNDLSKEYLQSVDEHADDIQGIKSKLDTMKYDLETQLAYEVGKLDTRISHVMSASPNDVEGRLTEEILTLRSKLEENEQTVKTTVDHVNTTLRTSLGEMNQSIEKLTETVHVNEFNAEMTRDRVEQIKSDIKSKQDLIDELRQRLDQLSTSLAQDVETLKQSVVYKDQIEEADTVADEFDDKISRIKSEFKSELETQVHKLQDEIDQLVDRKLSRLDTASPFEEKLGQEVMQYKEQVQSLRLHLQEMQSKQTDELSSIKEQYNSLNPLSRIEECQKEIQSVEGRIASILSDLEKLHLESKTNQAVAEETRTTVNTHSIVLEQIPTIKQNILQIEQKIDEIKQEFNSHVTESAQTTSKLDSLTDQVNTIEKKSDELNTKTDLATRKALDLSETCRLLDEEYKLISSTFKSQYDALQKRYQELHTIMVSNMEETERGNQSVRELIDLHSRIEQEYKELTSSYEQQQLEYKTSLQQRDDRLKLLEDQFKQQLDHVGSQLTTLQEQGDSSSARPTHSARIEELAQPRHITQKK